MTSREKIWKLYGFLPENSKIAKEIYKKMVEGFENEENPSYYTEVLKDVLCSIKDDEAFVTAARIVVGNENSNETRKDYLVWKITEICKKTNYDDCLLNAIRKYAESM